MERANTKEIEKNGNNDKTKWKRDDDDDGYTMIIIWIIDDKTYCRNVHGSIKEWMF